MGTITYSIPQSGQPNSTEDVKVATALNQLLTLVNGHIDGANLNPSSGILVAGAWTALTLSIPAGITGLAGGYTPSARLEGDIVRLKGQLKPASGSVVSGTTLATLPVGMRPSQTVFISTVDTSAVAQTVQITAAGLITTVFTTLFTPLTLDGITFTLS